MKHFSIATLALSVIILAGVLIAGGSAPAVAGCVSAYTVQPGDVLSRIAVRSGWNWRELAQRNDLANPHLIFPGQHICIKWEPTATPALDSMSEAPGTANASAQATAPAPDNGFRDTSDGRYRPRDTPVTGAPVQTQTAPDTPLPPESPPTGYP